MRRHTVIRFVMVPFIALALVATLVAILALSNRDPLIARAAPQPRPLGYEIIDTDTTWGPGVVTKTSDVVIKNGATLTVVPSTTVVIGTWDIPTDTAPYAGGASDKVEIIVEAGGRLVADGLYTETQFVTPTQSITFTSGTRGDPPWGGLRILGGSSVHFMAGDVISESVISFATIEFASGGIYVENSSPVVRYNLIRHIDGTWGDNGTDGDHGADGADGTATTETGGTGMPGGDGGDAGDGDMAYGLYISGTHSAPWVAFNTIYDVEGGGGGFGGDGGAGGDGGDGYSPDPGPGQGYDGGPGGNGGAGGSAGDGGDAAGVYVHSANPTLLANEIEEISGGSGGAGGSGGDGGFGGSGGAGSGNAAQEQAYPGGDAKDAGAGGHGGMSGMGGQAWGIYVTGDAAPEIRRNTLLFIYGGRNSGGGAGGTGGDGGSGGNAGGWSVAGACGSASAGVAGQGGPGGNGGDAMPGAHAAGIYTTNECQAQVVDNYILGVFGGSGGMGGSPGSGGAGGNGADGRNGSTGGNGGVGGLGGDGGVGGLAAGLRDPGATPDFRRNTMLSVHGGNGGSGGSGYYGDGGHAGDGGNSACEGSGGSGGIGGKGPSNGNGGDAGNGVGILSDTTVDVENNVVYGISGGSGGPGGLSYHPEAGDGGNGGAGSTGHDGGPNGDGGDGGDGGDAGRGGNGADGLGILAAGSSAAPHIVNNTVDRLDLGTEGDAGVPGTGGNGGLGGSGIGDSGANGADGDAGATAQAGQPGMTVGLIFSAGATGDVYNNIIVRTAYTTTDYYVGTFTDSTGISGTTVVHLDYNDVWGWETNYAGVTVGMHDISADPLFADVLCMDCEDFRPRAGSPCIDAADDAQAPQDDRDNILRPQDGDMDSVSIADIGAHEVITGNVFTIGCDTEGAFTTMDERLDVGWSAGMCSTCTITTTYTPLAYPAASAGALAFGELAFALNAVDCHGNPVTELTRPLSLTLHYEEPAAVDEETLDLYRWDPMAWMWEALLGTRDTASNTVTVALDHLSDFALLGEPKAPVASADLSVGKMASGGTVMAGERITYTITITNAGPTTPITAVVVDRWAPVAAVSAVYAPGCEVDLAGGTITCTQKALPLGTAYLPAPHVIFTTSEMYSGTLANTATITPAGDVIEPDSDNNVAMAAVTVRTEAPSAPAADLSIGKMASGDTVTAGERITYTITITNAGPTTPITAMVVDHWTPVGAISAVHAPGCDVNLAGGTITCTEKALPLGTVYLPALYLVFTTSETFSGTLGNSASITPTGDIRELNSADNAATATVTVMEKGPEGAFIFLPVLMRGYGP